MDSVMNVGITYAIIQGKRKTYGHGTRKIFVLDVNVPSSLK